MGSTRWMGWCVGVTCATLTVATGCMVDEAASSLEGYDAESWGDGGTPSHEAFGDKASGAGLGAACNSDDDCESGNCHEEGSTDRCRPSSCTRSDRPGQGTFCEPSRCGPCRVGEGDCDNDRQCLGSAFCEQVEGTDRCAGGTGAGLGEACESDSDCDSGNCHEEGSTDRCRPSSCTASDRPGQGEFCEPSNCGPCRVGEGDCDDDDQCLGSAQCKQQDGTDVCVSGSGGGGSGGGSTGTRELGEACTSDSQCVSGNCHEEGATDRCRPGSCTASDSVDDREFCEPTVCGPCRVGEGDCDSDAQCLGDAKCGQIDGTDFCVGSNDQCPSDPDKTVPGECGCGVPEGSCSGGSATITHVGTTETYKSNGQSLSIARPSGSRTGDLLVLFLHRTDDVLPLRVDGWTYAAACFKENNGFDCATAADCTDWYDGRFCRRFKGDEAGRDLAQTVLYRTVKSDEANSYRFNLNRDSSGHPGWAVLTALRGANTNDPVRDWSHEGCDGNVDSVFPSVYGRAGDMVLLSQSFDDAIAQSKFGAPSGMRTFGYVSKSDEAGFLFGGIVDVTGQTGSMKTSGSGGPSCKDGLVSLTIRPR